MRKLNFSKKKILVAGKNDEDYEKYRKKVKML